MHKFDLNRIQFYSIGDLASGDNLSKAEPILKEKVKNVYEDINDIMELYNIKKYIDNEVYLKVWTEKDINTYKSKVIEYGKIVGLFMSKINSANVCVYFEQLIHGYTNSFWELVNNQKIYKQIPAENFASILSSNPHEIRSILCHKDLVAYYKNVLQIFLLNYPQSAEILLSIYECQNDVHSRDMHLPKTLTIQDKENIILKYLESEDANLNYFKLIQQARDRCDFKVSPKTRLKAKQRYKEEHDRLFEGRINSSLKYGVSVAFSEGMDKIKQGEIEDNICNYSYNGNFIKRNNDNYSLFHNFKLLFEYMDEQGRIDLISKKNDLGLLEKIAGVHSQNEYMVGIAFSLSEMTSHTQIIAYHKYLDNLGCSLENVIEDIFTTIFSQKYNFADNARLMIPINISYLERVRLLAPEFESVLKQYKLFVEEGCIDFDLLQIVSSPCTIKEIPSLVSNKYIYLNEENNEIVGCSNLFFSDQSGLSYVSPFKDKKYTCFFDLIVNENVDYNNYENYQKTKIDYLIEKNMIFIDNDNFVQIANYERILILKDLRENEVASFNYYPPEFQEEVIKMEEENMLFFDSSLFSKPEQSYFNYLLNKSEFTNGIDLRNSYLHGTQANPKDIQLHQYAYFVYLKLIVLVLLKIEDDLLISHAINNEK